MRFLEAITVVCLLATNTPVLAHPQSISEFSTERRDVARQAEALFAPVNDLWKRKGGGGGGGKGGGGGGGGKGSSGGKGGSTSGYVPLSTRGEGRDHSNGEEKKMDRVTGVGSSTSASSSLSPSRDRPRRAAHGQPAVENLSKPAAGEVKDVSLRPSFRPRRLDRRFLYSGTISSRTSIGVRMVPSGYRIPTQNYEEKKDDANKHSAGATGRGSAGSNAGGSTKTGSGVAPRFGNKYGGGAAVPYTAGGRSPRGNLAPVYLGAGLLAIYPGLWLYGAYGYGYHNPYNFRNRTARRNSTDTNTTNTPSRDLPEIVIRQDDAGVNETKPVTCLCAQYAVCGCDDDGDYTFLDSIIGDGDYFKLNQSLATVADVNGTSTILLNGTLPNGTTASGGTEDASAAVRSLGEASGYWVMIAAVGLTCFVI